MANYTIINKSHDEWLRNREDGIGSSEVATVLGVNPYQTPYQLWLLKTGRIKADERENFLMKAGHYLEDAISRFCADEAGLEIIKSSSSEFIVVNKEKEFLRVSPDRFAFPVDARHTKENKVIIECKSTQNPVDKEDISKYWFTQVSYQLGVTELNRAYIAWLTQGRSFDYKVINFDPDFFAFIVEEVERFWVDCIIGGMEPALSNLSDVLIKYPKHEEGKTITADGDLIELWSELKDTNAEIKRLQSTKDDLEAAIKTSMLDAERLVIPAGQENPEKTIATWRASKDSKKFDIDAFREAEPETYAKYLRDVAGGRRFSIK